MSVWLRVRFTLDRLVALAALLPGSLVVLIVGRAIRHYDSGPALIPLERVGQGGRRFRMWKLRTMCTSSAGVQAGGPAITSANDSRVTGIGLTLRRWRIDEAPQLWNVVCGEMALIGPRPEAPRYVKVTEQLWRDVLAARPAIVGPSQVLFHELESRILTDIDGEVTYRQIVLPVKLLVDRWYVENASPKLDAIIVLSLLQSLVFKYPATATVLYRRLSQTAPAIAVQVAT